MRINAPTADDNGKMADQIVALVEGSGTATDLKRALDDLGAASS